MAEQPLTSEETLRLLRQTPARITALTAGLSQAQLRQRPRPDEWSANEILAHMRACADVRGDRIPAIAAGEVTKIRAISPRAYMRKTDYLELEFGPSFEAFASQRAKLVAFLKPLPAKGWSRTVRVTGLGAPRELTVLFYAQWVARHEMPHLEQIASIVDALRE